MEHSHDVQAIWDFWPINLMIPTVLSTYMNGYGINPITTYLDDISFWPRYFWNGFFSLLTSWNISLFFTIPGWILSAFTYLPELPLHIWRDIVVVFRYLFH